MPDAGKRPGLALAAIALAAFVAGCAAGPRYVPPPAPRAAAYTSAPQPDSAGGAAGGAQRFVAGGNAEAQWWRALGSPALDTLIAGALEASPTLASAEATLRQAKELLAAQAGGSRLPQVDAALGGQRQRFNPAALGQSAEPKEFSLLSSTVSVKYRLDLSGGNRRALEALVARADHRAYQLAGARVTLAAAIAGAAVNRAKLAAQVDAAEAMLRVEEEQLVITRERLRLGAASPDEVLSAQIRRDQARSGIPNQRKQLEQSEHLLGVLAGREPGAGGVPPFAMSDFTLPPELPLVVPSELVRRRPDILAAEALMRAANAEYGVAVAKLYPQVNLGASLGSQALSAGGLFGAGSAVWSLLAQLTQPLLNPGLPAEKRAALAAFDAAAANYQGVVLESLRGVADILSALDADARSVAALSGADAASQEALESLRRQYALGAASYLQVLAAELQAQQARANLISARAQRLVDSVALYQAVGGGQVVPDTAPASPG